MIMAQVLKIIWTFIWKYRKYIPVVVKLIIKLLKRIKKWQKEKASSHQSKKQN